MIVERWLGVGGNGDQLINVRNEGFTIGCRLPTLKKGSRIATTRRLFEVGNSRRDCLLVVVQIDSREAVYAGCSPENKLTEGKRSGCFDVE